MGSLREAVAIAICHAEASEGCPCECREDGRFDSTECTDMLLVADAALKARHDYVENGADG